MDELIKINRKIKFKQFGRLIGAGLCTFGSAMMITKFSYQKGITDCQRTIRECYPDLYKELTEEVLKNFEVEHVTHF